VNESDVRTFLVPHPAVREQRRIASILDTVDDAIRQTEQVIAKLQQMKQGLLHDLLTRGMDENGDLRPSPTEAPHLYKDSPLGRIPRGWNSVAIGQIGETITGRTPPSGVPGVWGDDLPFVTPGEISSDGTLAPCSRYVSKKGRKYVRMIPPRSLLVVCIGSTLGKTAVTSVDCATNQQINAVVPSSGVDAGFLEAALRLRLRHLLVLAGLQAVPIVNRTLFESMWLAVAPHVEQTRIAQILSDFDSRVQKEVTSVSALRTLKQGLRHDLLTGRVRVPLPAEASA
jgi:type I restriction enzyme S subunit